MNEDIADDVYFTVARDGEGQVREKMSRFIAFARHVESADEAKTMVKEFQNRYHDARHVCWAYMLGAARAEWQLNDNGEPSGTAGKPILGQINSLGLTDVAVVVVRYFGGIKLGTPGLTAAYRQSAREALEDAGRLECHRTETFTAEFPYEVTDKVMRVAKGDGVRIRQTEFDCLSRLVLEVRASVAASVRGRLEAAGAIVR